MTVFALYSRYYDLLYSDKDYSAEARYVAALIRESAPHAASLLELGCGTGAHAVALAECGFEVQGVDLSEGMLERALARKEEALPGIASKLMFTPGDARSVRLGRKFDGVISLFHVMSYQSTNADLSNAFQTAREHVHERGVFLFDCWYGPAVLTQRPAVTHKTLEDDEIEVSRVAEPLLHVREDVVDVNYCVTIREKQSGRVDTLRETHRMRYLFEPEIQFMLSTAGFNLVQSHEWMSMNAPGPQSWAACFVATAF